MSEEFFSIQVEGEQVDFSDFVHVVFHARELLADLAKTAVGDDEIIWPLVGLTFASPAVAKWAIRTSNPRANREIVGAWGEHAEALEAGREPPGPKRARDHAVAISQVVNGRTSAVVMGVDQSSWKIVVNRSLAALSPPDTKSFGVVEGELDQLRGRSQTFAIFDPVFERQITCDFSAEQRRELGDFWVEHKRIQVEGLITRDGRTGRPKSVRDVKRIDGLRVASDEELMAVIGAVKPRTDSPSPEQIIRRVRDAE